MIFLLMLSDDVDDYDNYGPIDDNDKIYNKKMTKDDNADADSSDHNDSNGKTCKNPSWTSILFSIPIPIPIDDNDNGNDNADADADADGKMLV